MKSIIVNDISPFDHTDSDLPCQICFDQNGGGGGLELQPATTLIYLRVQFSMGVTCVNTGE